MKNGLTFFPKGVHFFRVSMQLLKAYWQETLAYRGMVIIWGIHSIMVPFVLMFVWLAVERGSNSPYQDGDYILYYLAMPLVMNFIDCWTVFTFPEELREGYFNRQLLKPLHPIWGHVFEHIAAKAFQLLCLVPIVFSISWFMGDYLPDIDFSFRKIALLFFALLFAVVLRFVMNTTLAMTGFWIEHVETLNLVFNQAIWALLGGMVTPIETLPPIFRIVTDVLPYRYTLSFPIEILRGKISNGEIIIGFVVMVCWLFLFSLAGRALWRAGLRIYTAYGG
ncbi:ABC-2 family transporter protein [bacterium]|nr:ABC-2 family transporter protein [bacterium]